MSTIKEKAVQVWDDHKAKIIIGGATIGALGLSYFGYSKFVKGYKLGAVNSFWLTLKWLDETFPEMDATKTVMEYQRIILTNG